MGGPTTSLSKNPGTVYYTGIKSGNRLVWRWDEPQPDGVSDVVLLPRTDNPEAKPPLIEFSWGESIPINGNVSYIRSGSCFVVLNTVETVIEQRNAHVWNSEVTASIVVVTGSQRFLPIVPAYKNFITAPRALANGSGNWTNGIGNTDTANNDNGPDGTLNADWDQISASTGLSPYIDFGSNTRFAYSGWARAKTGSEYWTMICTPTISPGNGTDNNETLVGTGWGRKGMSRSNVRTMAISDGRGTLTGSTAHSASLLVDCQMAVHGISYLTPFTTGSVGVTSVKIPFKKFVSNSGWFDVTFGSIIILDKSGSQDDGFIFNFDNNSGSFTHNTTNKHFTLWLQYQDGTTGSVVGSTNYTFTTPAVGIYSGSNLGKIRIWNLTSSFGFQIENDTESTNYTSLIPAKRLSSTFTGSVSFFPDTIFDSSGSPVKSADFAIRTYGDFIARDTG